MKLAVCLAAAAVTYSATGADAGEVKRASFGTMADGAQVEAITLNADAGFSATIITYGAGLQALKIPDANGRLTDVALGHATLAEYVDKRQFMGATVGRIANRIGRAAFVLDGRNYKVTANDGANALHGGIKGFDQAVWEVVGTRSGTKFAEVELRHVSPDGDQGFPGRVETTVRYRVEDGGVLRIDLAATTDRPTVVSLSNHAYWNLAGEGAASGAMALLMEIPADRYLPVAADLIPTGEMRPVAGTVFDFRMPRPIGERVRTSADEQIRIGRGYDHNWIVTPTVTASDHLMARVTDPASGRRMELWSAQPGLQFYSGNFLDGTTHGKTGQFYRQGDAIVLEPQAFPDVVNRPSFGSVRLVPGQTYRNSMTYRFSIVAPAARH